MNNILILIVLYLFIQNEFGPIGGAQTPWTVLSA
jgi:hypothetical protein